MINISLETHLPIAEIDPDTLNPVIKWRDRTTGKCGRIDHVFEWSYDGSLPKSVQYLFEDTFGMTEAEYTAIHKAARNDPDFERIKALGQEYDERRHRPLTIREAKAKLADELRDHPSFRGIGVRGPTTIVVMWADHKDQPASWYEEYQVEIAITGEAHLL